MTVVRRNYKDSLFCRIFGTEEGKGNALDLYNALSGSNLSDPGILELTTIGDAVFLGVKNDVSYLVGDEMLLWEHQSTHNPNMPLRGLHYFLQLYTKLVETRGLDIYGAAPLSLPTPRFVVFYFGERERPESEIVSLSDSFTSGPGDLEVTATVLNCNEGRNGGIMSACEALRGYAHLVALERRCRRDLRMELHDAVREAIGRCIEDGFLVDYLTAYRAEAEDMLFTIQDEERAMRVHEECIARDARQAGLEQGLQQGLLQSIQALMESTGCDADRAMDMLQIPAFDREALAAKI